MGKAMGFEELIIWQKARVLVKEIYSVMAPVRDYGFSGQIQRAAVSVMNNIAEGYDSGTTRMLENFFNISSVSCGEVRSMLYIAMDLNYLEQEKAVKLMEDCRIIAAGIKSFVRKMKNRN